MQNFTFEKSRNLVLDKLGIEIAMMYTEEFNSYIQTLNNDYIVSEYDVADFFLQFIKVYFIQPKQYVEKAVDNIDGIINHEESMNQQIQLGIGKLDEFNSLNILNIELSVKNFEELLYNE